MARGIPPGRRRLGKAEVAAARGTNRNLRAAKKAKKDEFYTQLTDIEKELKHYKKHFKNKVVLCNCDDPLESNFVKYFSLNFEHLGLKKLIATHYRESDLFSKQPPYKLEYTGDKNGNKMPDLEEYSVEMLGDGDFRSPECVKLLQEADIVVTNPPFSLFREYVAQLMEHKKKFLIIGNMNALIYKEIFPLFRDDKAWLGLTNPKEFGLPSGETQSFGNICWYTNLPHKKRTEKLTLYKKYSKKEYLKYANFDAINVDKIADIPTDYAGLMGVPITFLGKYNPEQFELVGFGSGNFGLEMGVKPCSPDHRAMFRSEGKLPIDGNLYFVRDGKVDIPYKRFIIRNLQVEK